MLLALICKKKYINFDLAENICKFINFNIPDIKNEAYEYQPMRQRSSTEIYQLIKFNNIPRYDNTYILDLESDIKTKDILEIVHISGKCPYIGLVGYDIKTNSEKRIYYNIKSQELLYIVKGVTNVLKIKSNSYHLDRYNTNIHRDNMYLVSDNDNGLLDNQGNIDLDFNSIKYIDLEVTMNMNCITNFDYYFTIYSELDEICKIKGPLKYSLIMYNDTEILINEGLAYQF